MDTSRIARDHFFYVCFRVGKGFEERQMEISFFHRDDDDDFDTCFISCLRWRLREERRIYGFIIDLRLI